MPKATKHHITPAADPTHAIAVLNSRADQITGHPRFMPVEGDAMAPTLTFRHLAAVVPVTKYCGEGIYVLDVFGKPDFFRVHCMGRDGAWLRRDNTHYAQFPMPWADFEAALLGKVAAICNVIEPALFGRA